MNTCNLVNNRHILSKLKKKNGFYSSSHPKSVTKSNKTNAQLFDERYNYVHSSHDPYSSIFSRQNVQNLPTLTSCVPIHIQKPPYANTGIVSSNLFYTPPNYSPSILHKLKLAGKVARRTLEYACSLIEPDISTDEIDRLVHDFLVKHHAYPSPLNYQKYPKSVCTSINEVICHGVPNKKSILKQGDIVSLDISCFIHGVHADNCSSVIVGENHTHEPTTNCIRAKRLIQATKEALTESIKTVHDGSCLTEIGQAIEDVASSYGYESVQTYRGHCIGEELHIPPFVKHYKNNDFFRLKKGMVFTIEPMLTDGKWDCHECDIDGWTVVTKDGSRSAQFEHMIYVSECGCEILTKID